MESRPRDWRWPLSDVLGWAALLLVFGITFLLYFVLARAGIADAGFWAAIPFAFGMILLVVAWVLDPSPYRLMRAGDRPSDWDRVGWPEH